MLQVSKRKAAEKSSDKVSKVSKVSKDVTDAKVDEERKQCDDFGAGRMAKERLKCDSLGHISAEKLGEALTVPQERGAQSCTAQDLQRSAKSAEEKQEP